MDSRSGHGPTAQKLFLPRPLTGPLPKILDAMIELPAAAFPELARALLCCVPQAVRQPAPQPVNRAKSLLEDVCIYLQNHYQYDITRNFVARQFNVSPNHLSRVF